MSMSFKSEGSEKVQQFQSFKVKKMGEFQFQDVFHNVDMTAFEE